MQTMFKNKRSSSATVEAETDSEKGSDIEEKRSVDDESEPDEEEIQQQKAAWKQEWRRRVELAKSRINSKPVPAAPADEKIEVRAKSDTLKPETLDEGKSPLQWKRECKRIQRLFKKISTPRRLSAEGELVDHSVSQTEEITEKESDPELQEASAPIQKDQAARAPAGEAAAESRPRAASMSELDARKRFEARRREDQKCSMLRSQFHREREARVAGRLIKCQRVRYFHKFSETWIENAHIVGVHSEDDPENPYFTIRYLLPESGETIEKQTTRDRLAPEHWDAELTWAIISTKL